MLCEWFNHTLTANSEVEIDLRLTVLVILEQTSHNGYYQLSSRTTAMPFFTIFTEIPKETLKYFAIRKSYSGPRD